MSVDKTERAGEVLERSLTGDVAELSVDALNQQLLDSTRSDSRPYATSVSDLTTHFGQGNGSFEGYVPATIVERDLYLPFKRERTDELVSDLRKTRARDGWGNGQDSPMLAAYITGEAEPTIEVYDGLHRQVANIDFQESDGIEIDRPAHVIAAIGDTAIHFVTVKPMTRHDMLDKRLSNTHNHPELRFARGGLWSAQLWYLDDISALAPDVSAKQAFNLAERSSKDANRLGARLGLSPEVVEQVAEWATVRAETWKVDPSTVYKWILRAEATTPEIIAQVRNVGKGHDGRGVITESMVISIANFMAGEEYHDTQSVIVNFATHNQLSEIQFNNLLAEVMSTSRIKDVTDIDQVVDFLEQLDVNSLDSKTKTVAKRRIRRRTDIFNKGGAAVASVGDAIDRVEESLDVRDERLHFVPDVDQRRAAIEAAEELEAQAERALALADRARQHASDSGDSRTRSQSKPRGFGTVTRMPAVRSETHEAVTPSETMHEFREILPAVKEDALSGQWGPAELDDALEIATNVTEVLARLASETRAEAENDTNDAA